MRSMLFDRQQDRFVYFVTADIRHGRNFDAAHSREVIADCVAGWQISVPTSDERAVTLFSDVFHGDTAYDRRGILALMRKRGVKGASGPFDHGHCTCKVRLHQETHLVDD